MSDSDDKKKTQTSPPPKKSGQPWWQAVLVCLLGAFLGGLIVFLVIRSDSLFTKSDGRYNTSWDEYNRRVAATGKLSRHEH